MGLKDRIKHPKLETWDQLRKSLSVGVLSLQNGIITGTVS